MTTHKISDVSAKLSSELTQATHQLESLFLERAQFTPEGLHAEIDRLYQECNQFADQLDALEQQSVNIHDLEFHYITLLIDLAQFDETQCHQRPQTTLSRAAAQPVQLGIKRSTGSE